MRRDPVYVGETLCGAVAERPAAQRQEREKWFHFCRGPVAYRCPAYVQGYWL